MLFLPILLTIATPFLALWGESLLAVSHDSSLVLRMSHVLVRLVGGQPVLVVTPPMYELVHVTIAVAQPMCLWSEKPTQVFTIDWIMDECKPSERPIEDFWVNGICGANTSLLDTETDFDIFSSSSHMVSGSKVDWDALVAIFAMVAIFAVVVDTEEREFVIIGDLGLSATLATDFFVPVLPVEARSLEEPVVEVVGIVPVAPVSPVQPAVSVLPAVPVSPSPVPALAPAPAPAAAPALAIAIAVESPVQIAAGSPVTEIATEVAAQEFDLAVSTALPVSRPATPVETATEELEVASTPLVEYLGACLYHKEIMDAYAKSTATFVVYTCRVCQDDPDKDFMSITIINRGSTSTANGMAPGVVIEMLPADKTAGSKSSKTRRFVPMLQGHGSMTKGVARRSLELLPEGTTPEDQRRLATQRLEDVLSDVEGTWARL